MPGSFFKQYTDQMTAVFTEMTNLSLNSSELTKPMRHALLWLLPKKQNLDPELVQYYRPVSSL